MGHAGARPGVGAATDRSGRKCSGCPDHRPHGFGDRGVALASRVLVAQRGLRRVELERSTPSLTGGTREVAALTATELARLEKEEQGLTERLSGLRKERDRFQSWTARHPEVERRLDRLTADIASLDEGLGWPAPPHDLPRSLQPERWAQLAQAQDREIGLDLGR